MHILDVVLENLPGINNDRDRWRERESGKSVLLARLDDDDDDYKSCDATR